MESFDWLSTENEDQKHETESLFDTAKETDILITTSATTKGMFDKMKTQHGRMQASFLEQSVSLNNLLAMHSKMATVSAERAILKTEYEVMAMDNSTLRQQVEDMCDAGEDMKECMIDSNKAVLSL
jgi:hypothetical protein